MLSHINSNFFIMSYGLDFKWPNDTPQSEPLSCWPRLVVPPVFWWSLRWQVRCAQVTLDPLCAFLFSHSSGAACPHGVLICGLLRQINVPSALSQTGSMDQHFFSVCVCISFRYLVFTNLSPFPALPKTTASSGIASSLCQPLHWLFRSNYISCRSLVVSLFLFLSLLFYFSCLIPFFIATQWYWMSLMYSGLSWPISEPWPVWIHYSWGNSEQFRACERKLGQELNSSLTKV